MLFLSALTWVGASAWAAPSPVLRLSPPVKELSGAVTDPFRNRVWSIGDSGTGAWVGVTDLATGSTRLAAVPEAINTDWEAIVLDEKGTPWILDVGDNNSVRRELTAYALHPEGETSEGIPLLDQVTFQYADGPRDCEAAAFLDGRLFLFEKKLMGRPRVASLDVTAGPYVTAREEGRLSALTGPITDASVTPQGSVYLLTYLGIHRCHDCSSPRLRNLERVRSGYRGQAEALLALSEDLLLVAAEEDGAFYRW